MEDVRGIWRSGDGLGNRSRSLMEVGEHTNHHHRQEHRSIYSVQNLSGVTEKMKQKWRLVWYWISGKAFYDASTAPRRNNKAGNELMVTIHQRTLGDQLETIANDLRKET